MAYLTEYTHNERCYLYAHHSFGRLAHSVETQLSEPHISKVHAIVQWRDSQWEIKDLSRNGTWLNGKKLVNERAKVLQTGDRVGFTDAQHSHFVVSDLSPPADMLLPCEPTFMDKRNEAIVLQHYQLLPNDKHPEIAVIFDLQLEQWRIEPFDKPFDPVNFLNDGDYIDINHQRWQLRLSLGAEDTQLNEQFEYGIKDLAFVFDLTQDEETTRLRATAPDLNIDLQARVHHYLTLNLARHRVADEARGVELVAQGWINTDDLGRELGIDTAHLNIQIHRVRKQFSDLLGGYVNADELIERRFRQVRFGGECFQIIKGGILETRFDATSDNKPHGKLTDDR
jgi:hypothetical protein